MEALNKDDREELPLAMRVDDLMKALQISRGAAYTLVNRADFPCVRLGKTIRIPRELFLQWLKSQAKGE